METVSNVVNAASKAIWGEQNTQGNTTANETAGNEPVSGLQGKGTPNEPFDQGNAENPADPAGKANVNNPTTTPSSDPTSTTNTSALDTKTNIPMNPTNTATGGEPKPLENTEGTGVTGVTGAGAQNYKPIGGDVIPSQSSNPGTDPASGATPEHKHQGAHQPKATPVDHETSAIKASKDKAEEALARRDPNDHSGEPMRMHGGGGNVPATQEERRESKAGMPGGQEHGKEKGTGEKWVKSTGLAADGGDFDATKPGAGREADRILEEKGIHKTGSNQSNEAEAQSPGSGGKEKTPLGDKIKQKLHIGHKDK